MAKTYTANSFNIGTPAVTAIGNGKSMMAIANTHASRVVKVWRIWAYPNNSAVTGLMVNFIVRRFTTLTGGTAITPVPHDSANVSVDLTSISVVTGATITSPTQMFGCFFSSEEVTVSGATNNHLLSFYPFCLIWDAGVGDANVEPITLRQNQGCDLLCNTNSTAGNFDIIFEFTVE
jgi:hypothetical protein